jgi:zinc transporter ZupT
MLYYIRMTFIIFTIATFVSVVLGGVFSLKNKHRLHLVMGFAAGILLGVVAFDIIPEIIEMLGETGGDPIYPMIALVVGFLLFHVLEKSMVLHHSHEEAYADHKHPNVGIFSVLAIAGHSFMDGIGIGLGFQISPAVGALMAVAVISHNFTDGMNTITLMLTHKNEQQKALKYLIVVALAPVLGILSTLFFTVPTGFLILYLGFFAGFLLYIGASDILPEAHSKHSSWKTMAFTVLGAALMFVVTQLL